MGNDDCKANCLGWQLYRDHYEIVLDNALCDQEFSFIFQGVDLTVPASAARTLKSDDADFID